MRTLAEQARHLNLHARFHGMPSLLLLTDQTRLPDPIPLLHHLSPGSVVVLRHGDPVERARLGRSLITICQARRVHLLVAGDFALALRLGAGLHLPEAQVRHLSPRLRLWIKRQRRSLVTAAAHSRQAVRCAARAGVDAALLSPVFSTRSHPGAKTLGVLEFRRLCRDAAVPVYALGGITTRTAGRLTGSGAAGVATVGGLLS